MNLYAGSRKLTVVIVIVILAILLLFYSFVNPCESWIPKCPFYMLTGLYCPGCGSQRALHALLHADITGAWRYNPAMIISIPLLSVLVLCQLFPQKLSRLDKITSSRTFILFIALSFILWTIVRNLLPLQNPE